MVSSALQPAVADAGVVAVSAVPAGPDHPAVRGGVDRRAAGCRSAARSLSGKTEEGIASKAPLRGLAPAPAASPGGPCPRFAFQVMLPKSSQSAPSAVLEARALAADDLQRRGRRAGRSRCRRRARPAARAGRRCALAAHAASRQASAKMRAAVVRLRLADDQRRRQPDGLLAALQHQQAALVAAPGPPRRPGRGGRELDADHQAQAAHLVPPPGCRASRSSQPRLQQRAHPGGVRQQLALQQVAWWPAPRRWPPGCRRRSSRGSPAARS